MNQDEIFSSGEGDRWFERNRHALGVEVAAETDRPLELIGSASISFASVLEVGCANGWRLAALAERYGCRAVGVDASAEAVESGQREFPDVDLRIGVAADLPVDLDETFEMVIVNYVFHWIARERLLASAAEIDRCVADGGYLLVGDFLPDEPTAVPYHHLPGEGVFTYKLDYAGIFLSTALYQTIARDTYNHDDPAEPVVSSESRGAVTLMQKSLAGERTTGGTGERRE